MQFEQKTLTILDEARNPVVVQSWQGIGTGLAYHHPIYKDQPCGEEYILVHVPSGMCMSKLTLPTESEAQAFLESVAALDPDQWSFDLDEYKNRYYYNGRVLQMCGKIEAAHYAALIPRDEYMLFPEDADGEPNDDVVEAQSDDPEDSATKETVARLFSYSQSTVRVILASFNQSTGKHTDLHTYERPIAIEARK